MSELHLGTSGVSVPITRSAYPEAFRGKGRLTYYSSILNSLEVNSSFYRNPKPSTIEKWSAEVPDSFSFTFKLSKLISHAKHLAFNETDVHDFLEVVQHAGYKMHCILIQLPPSTAITSFDELKQLLLTIRGHSAVHIAVECRHESWYNVHTYALLHNHNATLVMHDFKKGKFNEMIDQPFYYYRFHGMYSNYRGSYDEDVLQAYAEDIRSLLHKNKPVYCYFNNTMGAAFENANRIKELVSK